MVAAVAPGITPLDLAAARRVIQRRLAAPTAETGHWQDWLQSVALGVRPPFAPYHAAFWDWVWSLTAGESARPFVAIWPRGFGKSQSAEVALAAVAARRSRTYCLYVCETQERADTHVGNVANLLESPAFAARYPTVARRRLGKYGNSQGWRRNRLRTASGFTVDAIGLDTAARGAKVDEDRPDLIVFDDIDDPLDSPGTVAKKITTITQGIIPAGAPHAAVLVVQNKVHDDGIVAQLADGRADFLADRIVSGPHPALIAPAYEQDGTGTTRIVGGAPTWDAMPIPALQSVMDRIGATAFRRELQHETDQIEGGIFGHVAFRHCAWDDVPPLDRIVVWVDPAVTDTDQSDAHGIQADGIAGGRESGTVYRLWSWEARTSPEDALRRAILKAIDLKAECVGVETDQGGDVWEGTYKAVWGNLVASEAIPSGARMPKFKQDKAGAGHGPKAHRASQMLVDYEQGRIVHVLGTHDALERSLRRFLIRKPYDLVDAAYWSWFDLRGPKLKRTARSF